jgi:S1-C subfamily serine protease
MKIFSTPSVLLLAAALGAGAGVVAAALTLGSLNDYLTAISAPNSIDLAGQRARPTPSDYSQAAAEVRERAAAASLEIFSAPSDATGAYEPGQGLTSGFFLTADGWLAAAPYSYYLSTAELAEASVLFDGKIYPVKKVVDNPASPIVFLKIEISGAPVVSFGNPLALEPGDNLFVAAAANELLSTTLFRSIKVGDISAPAETASRRLELNIAIDSRLAGAAVANSSGEVVGILVADQFGETRTVLPYTAFKSAVYSLLKEGRVISPWFGAISTDLSRAIGYDESYTRGYTKGTLLGTITKDSPAETAGLRRGDIVVSAGGLEISEKQSFDELLADYHVGDTLNLIIDRAGESLKVDVVLGAH